MIAEVVIENQRSLAKHKSALERSLKDRIRRKLIATGYPPLQSIDVHVQDNAVILRGVVETYFLKQLAGSIAAKSGNFERVDNAIIVL